MMALQSREVSCGFCFATYESSFLDETISRRDTRVEFRRMVRRSFHFDFVNVGESFTYSDETERRSGEYSGNLNGSPCTGRFDGSQDCSSFEVFDLDCTASPLVNSIVSPCNGRLDDEPFLSEIFYGSAEIGQCLDAFGEVFTTTVGGDPHITTFDGLEYDCQASAEFVLVKSADGEFEIQGRFESVGRGACVLTGLAIRRIGYYRFELSMADHMGGDCDAALISSNDWMDSGGNVIRLPATSNGLMFEEAYNYCITWCIIDTADSLFETPMGSAGCSAPYDDIAQLAFAGASDSIKSTCGSNKRCILDAVVGDVTDGETTVADESAFVEFQKAIEAKITEPPPAGSACRRRRLLEWDRRLFGVSD